MKKEQTKYNKYFTTRENFKPYKDVQKYYIEILFEEGGYEKFLLEKRLSTNVELKRVFSQAEIENCNLGEFSELYKIYNISKVEEMLLFSEKLSKFEHIKYAVVKASSTEFKPEVLPNNTVDSIQQVNTPDFNHLQEYLDKDKNGMNIREAWKKTTGRSSVVRHLDFGVFEEHEDLKGNINVVSNVNTEWRDHGTASTGVIAGIKNEYGVTGISHDCSFFFYDEAYDLDEILRDSKEGDIVSLDVHYYTEVDGEWTYLPMIALYDWWYKIKKLTNRGVIVLLAAGNGGNDVSALINNGFMEDFADCGVFLVGQHNPEDGRRVPASNYNYHSSYLNSWGDYVTTTGYGDLAYEGNPNNEDNRNYARRYGGTSAATPLCAGAIALMQSYSKETYDVFLSRAKILKIVKQSGDDKVEQGIGHQPNVAEALPLIDELFKNK